MSSDRFGSTCGVIVEIMSEINEKYEGGSLKSKMRKNVTYLSSHE